MGKVERSRQKEEGKGETDGRNSEENERKGWKRRES